MRNPFRLTTPKPSVASFADAFQSPARKVWDSLTAEERIVVMADMTSSPSPPKLIDEDGDVRPMCRATLVLVVDAALGLSPAQFQAIGTRIKAQFELARAVK